MNSHNLNDVKQNNAPVLSIGKNSFLEEAANSKKQLDTVEKSLSPSTTPATSKLDDKKQNNIDHDTNAAIEKLDPWMKQYKNHGGTDNEELLDWLTYDRGRKHIRNYDHFCEVAAILQKKGYKTSPPPSEEKYYQKLGLKKKVEIYVHESKKPHLRGVQIKFSLPRLANTSASDFSEDNTLFLYSNDCKYIPNYFTELFSGISAVTKSKSESFTLLDSLSGKRKKFDIGIIIGNGNILSLLPDLPINDIFLLDNDPRVHLFLLKVKELILDTNDTEAFDNIKQRLIKSISLLESEIMPNSNYGASSDSITLEIEHLGEKHYLHSKERFEQCKKALQAKEIIPINMDIFNHAQVTIFSESLKEFGCQILFMNLTNIADYDRRQILPSVIELLPLANNTFCISTALTGYSGRGKIPTCFASTTKKELISSLLYSYEWNRSPCMYKFNIA